LNRVSATICTLNEARNIRECILAVAACDPDEIIVVDASSEDDTVKIAKSLGAKVIVVPRQGLASQRNRCIQEARNSLIALFDADHRPEPDALRILARELEEFQADGIEAQILSQKNTGYWDWAMEMNFKLTHNLPGPRNMIGTPCVYRREALLHIRFDDFFTGPSDDTDLCYRMVRAGYRLRVGSAVVRQVHRTSFHEFRRKWLWYGSGDAQFIWKHPERIGKILFHQLIRYPILKSAKAVSSGQPGPVPFFIMAGHLRFLGCLLALLRLILDGNHSVKIVKT
jgi:glycosyltransferase involved in cell wall biosynthesis